MKFITMKSPLKYSVYCGKKEVIPAGAERVKIAFRQSHLRRIDEDGKSVPMNVYIYKGMVYHA